MATFAAVSSWLGTHLGFAGGLTQTDWFGLSTGAVGSTYAWTAYNLSAYSSAIGWRQGQLYQAKNYHLSWVAIARDDIRELMSVSVNRINNYMLVATLIMGIAADSLFWVNNFDPSCPRFIVNYFWLSTGVSIVFLAMSILLGIKGQNSAFVNTMRLLSWELRPENPGTYSHNYLEQVQRWERGGLSKLLRTPGRGLGAWLTAPSAASSSAQAERQSVPSASTSPSPEVDNKADEPRLEDVVPESRELVYLSRFAHFMRLWVPYEIYARFCIGMGFISLAQASAYFCLGSLSYSGAGVYRATLVFSMIILFVFLAGMIYHQNYTARHVWVHWIALSLFVWGPVASTLAAFAKGKGAYWAWARNFLACTASLGHAILFAAVYLSVTFGHKQLPADITNMYIAGPHGQKFSKAPKDYSPQPADHEKPENKATKEEGQGHRRSGPASSSAGGGDAPASKGEDPGSLASVWHHGIQNANLEAPTEDEEHHEDLEADAVLTKVVGAVQATSALASALWFAVFMVTALSVTHKIGPTALPLLEVHEVPIAWPVQEMYLHGLACAGDSVFVANRYQVFRLNQAISAEHPGGLLHESLKVEPERCTRNGTIDDITARCDRRGRHCWAMALMNKGTEEEEGPSRLVDCLSGTAEHLLQETGPVTKVAMRAVTSTGGAPINGTLVSVQEDRVVRYTYGEAEKGWLPMWDLPATGKGVNEVRSIDLVGNHLYTFGVIFADSNAGNISTLRVQHLGTGKHLGTWRLNDAITIAAGCASGPGTFMAVTQDVPPRFVRGELPKQFLDA